MNGAERAGVRAGARAAGGVVRTDTSWNDLTCGSIATRDVLIFFSSRRRHTRLQGDWSSDVCSSDLAPDRAGVRPARARSGAGRGGGDVGRVRPGAAGHAGRRPRPLAAGRRGGGGRGREGGGVGKGVELGGGRVI